MSSQKEKIQLAMDALELHIYMLSHDSQNPNNTPPSKYCRMTAVDLLEGDKIALELLKLTDQEKLIELPCKVGNTVYEIVLGQIEERIVRGFSIADGCVTWIHTKFIYNGKEYSREIACSDEDYTFYFTREEAEKKLEEMNNADI